MAKADALTDVTGTVPLDDAESVAAACERVLSRTGEDWDRDLLHASFAFAGDLFAGRHPGYLACDMPYHDLRHSLDAALIMARLVDGCRAGGDADGLALDGESRLAGVLLALLHDTGFLRRRDEAGMRGPELGTSHEARSAALAQTYFASTSLARHAGLAAMIEATRIAMRPQELFRGQPPSHVAIGRLLGSADLICQLADPRYLERCYHHLYPELVIGAERAGTPPPFRNARELLAGTVAFHDNLVRPRLERDFAHAARFLARHFGGADPYATSIRANLERCDRIVNEGRWDLLGPPPPTTTRTLDAAYPAPG
jgi:hypothetical protein